MKGFKEGLKYLAVFMAVMMVFASGAFVTSESFKAGDEEFGESDFDDEDAEGTVYVDADYEGEDEYDGSDEEFEDEDWDFGDEGDDIDEGLDDYEYEGFGYGDEEVYDDYSDDELDDEEYEDEDDEEDDDKEDEEIYKPSGSLECTSDNGITVSASFDEGIFTEDVALKASSVAGEGILPKLAGVIDDASDAIGVDIVFNDEDSDIWALDNDRVRFTLTAGELPEGDEYYLVSIDDDGRASKLSSGVRDRSVSFTSGQFGTYAIVAVTKEKEADEEKEAVEETAQEDETALLPEAAEDALVAVENTESGVYQVQVAALNGTRVYDGEGIDGSELVAAVIVNGNVISDYSLSDGGLSFTYEGKAFTVPGVSVSAEGDITDVGHYDIVVSGDGATAVSSTDPAYSCRVTAVNGSYEVTRREIVLTSASGEWRYDGKSHRAATVKVSGDGWLDGDEPVYYFPNSQKSVGQTENYFVLKSDAADNITDWASEYPNYNIVVAYGILRVNPAK